jgi:hypothetical protein
VGGDDGSGRGAHESLALAQIEVGAVLDARQDAHHPGFAEDAAATKNQDIGASAHALQATQAAGGTSTFAPTDGCT